MANAGSIQGVFFLIFGVGLIGVALQSLGTGVLPAGSKGLDGRTEFSRSQEPIRYWLMFALYGGGGVCLTLYALLLLTGRAAPLAGRS